MSVSGRSGNWNLLFYWGQLKKLNKIRGKNNNIYLCKSIRELTRWWRIRGAEPWGTMAQGGETNIWSFPWAICPFASLWVEQQFWHLFGVREIGFRGLTKGPDRNIYFVLRSPKGLLSRWGELDEESLCRSSSWACRCCSLLFKIFFIGI